MNIVGNDRPDQYQNALHAASPRVRARSATPDHRVPRTYSGGEMPMEESTSIGFDTHGNFTEDESSQVAKRLVVDGGDDRCYVLISTVGYDVGRLLNPYALYFRKEDVGMGHSKTGRSRYEFRQVSAAAFEDYMCFLRTRLETHLRNAERQVLDA